MKKEIKSIANIIAPIGTILCFIMILINVDTKPLIIVCSICIGMQIMLIVDNILKFRKRKAKDLFVQD